MKVRHDAMRCRGRITRHTTSEHTVCALASDLAIQVLLRAPFPTVGSLRGKQKHPICSGVMRG